MAQEWFPLSPKRQETGASTLFTGNPPYRTILGWARNGLCGGAIKLRLTRCGGRLGILRHDATAFEQAVERAKSPPDDITTPREDKARYRAAKRGLAAMGF